MTSSAIGRKEGNPFTGYIGNVKEAQAWDRGWLAALEFIKVSMPIAANWDTHSLGSVHITTLEEAIERMENYTRKIMPDRFMTNAQSLGDNAGEGSAGRGSQKGPDQCL